MTAFVPIGLWLAIISLATIGNGFAADQVARGAVSPLAGQASSELVSVDLYVHPIPFKISGAFFDNGTIVVPNAPAKQKNKLLCGDGPTYCVYAPGMFIARWLLGTKQLRLGNEIFRAGSMYREIAYHWNRLPGKLVIRLYVDANAAFGISPVTFESSEIDTEPGQTYQFEVFAVSASRGLKVEIRARPRITDVDVSDYASQRGTLVIAAAKGDLSRVKSLIGTGVDADSKTAVGATALMLASFDGHADIVRLLIDAHAQINTKWSSGETALALASKMGHAEIVKELIDAGADVNAMNVVGATALTEACLKGNADVVRLLIDAHADVNQPSNAFSALMEASFNGHADIVRLLMDAHADVNAAWNGQTALILASMEGHTDVVRELLDAKADVNLKDKLGLTALSYASHLHHKDIEELLRNAGAKK